MTPQDVGAAELATPAAPIPRDIAILGGTGQLGRGVGVRLAAAGHRITVGSRSVDRAEEAAAAIRSTLRDRGGTGDTVDGGTNEDAVARASVLFITAPASGLPTLLDSVHFGATPRIVIDCTVDLPGLSTAGFQGSAVRVQKKLGASARVAAAFHTVAASKLLDVGSKLDSDTLVVGDDMEAKQIAIDLARDMGLRAFDAGPLRNCLTLEHLTAMLIGMNRRYKRRAIGLRLTGIV